MNRRDQSLDALRGLAALSIAVLHTLGVPGGGLPGGLGSLAGSFLEDGLAVFFVLSGYLISGPFVRSLIDLTPSPDVRAYTLRRIARIGPGYWVAFAVTALAITTAPPSISGNWMWGSGQLGPRDWLTAAAFLQTAIPSSRAAGVLPVMWTLCVELVFYLLLPFITLAARRLLRGRPLAPFGAIAAVLAAWGLSILIESQLEPIALAAGAAAPAVYWLGFQISCMSLFCPGILLAVAWTRRGSDSLQGVAAFLRRPEIRGLAPLAILLLELAAYTVYLASGGDQGLRPSVEWRRQPAALAAGIALGLALTASNRKWRIAVRLLAPAGTISYGVYLYHWVVLRVLVDHHVYPLPVPDTALVLAKLALMLGLTLPLATASYLLVERPALRWAAERARRQAPARVHGVPAAAVPGEVA